jgi:hypothetical protein
VPDEYDAIRRRLTNYEKGLYFELGRARIRGETSERGWVRQFAIRIGKSVRVLDSARTQGRGANGVERKSGRVNERETLRQLKTERAMGDRFRGKGATLRPRIHARNSPRIPGQVSARSNIEVGCTSRNATRPVAGISTIGADPTV